MGNVELFLHELVSAPDQLLRLALQKEGKSEGSNGTLVVTAEEKKSRNN